MTWNDPEFILVDSFGLKDANDLLTSGVLFEVKAALGLANLNYQFGYIKELNQTLKQWGDTRTFSPLKFPLVWLEQPFTITRGNPNFYGQVDPFRVFIIQDSTIDRKAKERMSDVFKPVIYPIYRELLKQIDISPIFQTMTIQRIAHRFTDRYFFGEEDQSVLNDIIDCSIVQFTDLKINNNPNCVYPGQTSGVTLNS